MVDGNDPEHIDSDKRPIVPESVLKKPSEPNQRTSGKEKREVPPQDAFSPELGNGPDSDHDSAVSSG